MFIFFFFFQAEDGIRDIGVTGVQTCALPISNFFPHVCVRVKASASRTNHFSLSQMIGGWLVKPTLWLSKIKRSEERRVGKSVDIGGRSMIKKKKKIERVRAMK